MLLRINKRRRNRIPSLRLFLIVILLLSDGAPLPRLCEGLAAEASQRASSASTPPSTPASAADSAAATFQQSYRHARDVRIRKGHEAAQPLYERLLLLASHPQRGPRRTMLLRDATTATHLAADPKTPRTLLSIGHNATFDEMLQLREFLVAHQFTCQEIEKRFILLNGTASSSPPSASSPRPRDDDYIFASCPALYLKPAVAGSVVDMVEDKDERDDESDSNNDEDDAHDDDNVDMSIRRMAAMVAANKMMPIITSPAQCLVALFLLGLALPRSTVETFLATKHLKLLHKLHLVSTTTVSSSRAVVFANVQIFPIHLFDIPQNDDLYIITDWHPLVLSSTSIRPNNNENNKPQDDADKDEEEYEYNNEEESPVMYIGPDSLALVQHLPTVVPAGDCYCKHVLDLCTGSGIQAIACLLRQSQQQQQYGRQYDCHATCVDVSARALRFTRMNAMLNGIDVSSSTNDPLTLIQGNLLNGQGRLFYSDSSSSSMTSGRNDVHHIHNEQKPLHDLILQAQQQKQDGHRRPVVAGVDLITANPPFLPVPPAIVDARHGFFSAGGPSGEDVLEQIVRLGSQIFLANQHHHDNNNSNNNSSKARLAVVSEFFLQEEKRQKPISAATSVSHDNKDDADAGANITVYPSADSLLQRIQEWWKNDSDNNNSDDNIDEKSDVKGAATTNRKVSAARGSTKARGVLFTNQFPINAATYAMRRADNAQEANIWLHHLQNQKILFASPGLLFVQEHQRQQRQEQQKEKNVLCDDDHDDDENDSVILQHEIVPRSSQYGSIWTPSNPHAAAFTRQALAESLGWR
jgi:methylase of polypeptide subunit release factors